MKPIETRYQGCRFRSRLEARWAVFFDTLGIKWWYEPEGFALRFDYEKFAGEWDATEEELLFEGVPQTFKALDGKEYWYLPDFYLPELNYWIEIKGPYPSREELEKTFILHDMINEAARSKLYEAHKNMNQSAVADLDEMDIENEIQRADRAWEDFLSQSVYVLYGDILWPFPLQGNILGYGAGHNSGTNFFEESVGGGALRERADFWGLLNLCWQECPLCSKIGIGWIGEPYCQPCHDRMANLIWSHLAEDWGMSTGKTAATRGVMNQEFFTSGQSQQSCRRLTQRQDRPGLNKGIPPSLRVEVSYEQAHHSVTYSRR